MGGGPRLLARALRLPHDGPGGAVTQSAGVCADRAPVGALSLAAAVRLKPHQRRQLFAEQLPWALRAGRACPDLICLYYEEYLGEDLEALRSRWRIVSAPEALRAGKEISSARP